MSLGPSRGVPGHPHHPTRAAAPRLGCSARLGMKLRLSRPPLPPQISLNQKDGPGPSCAQPGTVRLAALLSLLSFLGCCIRRAGCHLWLHPRKPQQCRPREMSRAGLLLPEPNEYEWALHKRGFVSLNSFTPQCPWKGYSELNVNHRFTGTEPRRGGAFQKHLI